MRARATAKKVGNRPIPTMGKLYGYFKPEVVKTARSLKTMYTTDILANFSAKNRAPITQRSGSGTSPFGQKGTVWSAVGTNMEKTPLVWLDAGTKKRYRRMSFDWVSKTRPYAGIRFGVGRGRPGMFDFNEAMARKRRILPRNFRDDLIDEITPILFRNMLTGAQKLVKDLNSGRI